MCGNDHEKNYNYMHAFMYCTTCNNYTQVVPAVMHICLITLLCHNKKLQEYNMHKLLTYTKINHTVR